MPILIKNPSNGKEFETWAIIELQGDLLVRNSENIYGQFVGDLYYNNCGQPMIIIGHHILQGREQKMEKPLAVLIKTKSNEGQNLDVTASSQLDSSILDTTIDKTLLDSTVAIENKSRQSTEYTVRAIVTKKLIFRSRPKPVIANVGKPL